MWAFFDFGLLMPALVPAEVRNDEDVLAWTNNGEYDLQVRGRLTEHLQFFMDTYMEEGTFNPVIHATPQMDYNFRFYTTREAYAEGIKQAALAMDYEKFKVTSDRYEWNTEYHKVLNTIWYDTTRLNPPGGFYGPRSDANPNGYTNSNWWTAQGSESHYSTPIGRRIGDSFGIRDDQFSNVQFEEDDAMDWMPEKERKMLAIVEELDEANIPMAQWAEYTSPAEFSLLEPMLKQNFSKKVLKSLRRRNKETNFQV